METVQDLVKDEMLENVFGNADFGEVSKREVLANTLLKCACGYETGNTAKCIVQELGLVTQEWKLSMWGKRYLFAAFSNKLSV